MSNLRSEVGISGRVSAIADGPSRATLLHPIMDNCKSPMTGNHIVEDFFFEEQVFQPNTHIFIDSNQFIP